MLKYFRLHGEARPERRGGNRNADKKLAKRRAIAEHVSSFLSKATDYSGCGGAPGRKYLPSDLSVTKMHQLFLQQTHMDIRYSLYHNVFCHEFNLGFGRPRASDACLSSKPGRKDPNPNEKEEQTDDVTFMLN